VSGQKLLGGSVFVLAATFLIVAACGPGNRCEGVRCGDGESCNPDTGRCRLNFEETDAGEDAGTDGGVVDAGTCTPACTAAAPFCVNDACRVCTASAGCSGATPVCDSAAQNGAGQCVTCTEASGCAGATPVCDTRVSGGECVQCMEDADCPAQQPVCDLAARTCGPSADGGMADGGEPDPDGGVDDGGTADGGTSDAGEVDGGDADGGTPDAGGGDAGQDAGVVDAGIPGDNCASAIPISFPAGSTVAKMQVDTSQATDDYTAACSATGTKDLVYVLNVAAPTQVTVGAARPPGNATSDPVLYAGITCGQGDLGCSDTLSVTGGATEVLRFNAVPGPHYLVVEGKVAGPTDLTVILGDVPGDTCNNPVPITFPAGSNTTTFFADTGLAQDFNAAMGTCNTAVDSREYVYRLTLTAVSNVTITAARPAGGDSDPVIYVRKGNCLSGTQLSCQQSPLRAQTEVITLLAAAPDDYYLFVESAGPTSAGSSFAAPIEVTVTVN
jgi:hypothetical protein